MMEPTPGLLLGIIILTVIFILFIFFFFIWGFTRGFTMIDRAMGEHEIDKEYEIDSLRSR